MSPSGCGVDDRGATGTCSPTSRASRCASASYERILNDVNSTVRARARTSSELRDWRWNAITNYTRFPRSSFLGGWNVGGAVRWQDQVAIGYPIVDVNVAGRSLELPDLAHPYFGPTETKFDAWIGYGRKLWRDKIQWRIQLNVRDVLDDDDLVPVMAQPDGSIATWVAPQGRLFTLRSTFEF